MITTVLVLGYKGVLFIHHPETEMWSVYKDHVSDILNIDFNYKEGIPVRESDLKVDTETAATMMYNLSIDGYHIVKTKEDKTMKNLNLQPAYKQAPTELYIVKGARGDITPVDSYDKAVETAKMELATYLVGYENNPTRISSRIEDGIEMWWIEEQLDNSEWYDFEWNADGFVPTYTIERIY